MIAVAITGCGKAKHENPKGTAIANNAPSDPKKVEAVAIAMGAANNTRTELKTREKQWYIEWQSANIAIVNGQQSGDMFQVKGNAYEKGKVASSFFANHAEADKAADRLILDGGIKITSESTKAVLTAKKVEWLPKNKLFKASGDVLLDSPHGVVGPVDVLFADANLKKVASSIKYFSK
jgi:hypothetical protein